MGQRWSNGWRWPGLRRRWGVAGVVIAAAAGTLAPAAGPALADAPAPGAIVVSAPSSDPGAFQGWGTSLAWWANVVGGWSSMGDIDEELFGLPDRRHPHRLGLNVVRYDIGASPVVWCRDSTGADCAAAPEPGRALPVADGARLPAGC